MKTKFGFIAFVAVLVLFTWTTFGQKKNQPKVTWEYRTTGSASGTGVEELNKLGAQGWELVSVYHDERDGTTYYVKRAK